MTAPARPSAARDARTGGPDGALRPLLVQYRPADTDAHLRGLFLHGLAGSGSVWDGVWENAPTGLDAWTAELPWRVDHVSQWGQQEPTTDWLEAALDEVPGGPDVVIAHSYSASLLMDFLSREGERGTDPLVRYGIRGIVLVSPFYRRRAHEFEWNSVAGMQSNFLDITEEGIRAQSGREIDPEIRRHMARRVCERVGPYGWLRFFQTYLRTPWLRTDLIGVPCLVVTGQQDFAVSESVALATDLPDADLSVVPGCGHYPMVERPELFSALLDDFISRFPARAPAVGCGA